MGFSRHEYLSGLPFPIPRDLPKPGIEPASLVSPAFAAGFFITGTTWEALAGQQGDGMPLSHTPLAFGRRTVWISDAQ